MSNALGDNKHHKILEILADKLSSNRITTSIPDFAGFESVNELREHVIKLKFAEEAAFQKALAIYFDLTYLSDLDDVIPVDEFCEKIPIRYAKKFVFFPLKIEGRYLHTVVEDPSLIEPINELSLKFNLRLKLFVSTKKAILSLINRAYDRDSTTVEALDELEKVSEFAPLNIEEIEDLIDAADEEPIKRLVNSILWEGAKENASDIHFDATSKDTRVRYRIDGHLSEVSKIPKNAHLALVNRLKVMSQLDIAQKSMPQDGRTMILIAGIKIDIRISTVPTIHGEKIVLRLLYQSEEMRSLADLGLEGKLLADFEKVIKRSGGIVLVTGPTGSGKTTTLYAALSTLDATAENIITIEDPIEYKEDKYTQIEINHKLGLDFSNALRSVLRQDPDIIMVGEMRDAETAQIAIQAALTGHLVFSTLHTNSSSATITRLVDMGIEPFLVSSTVMAVLAQRLLRKICNDCKVPYTPHPEQVKELELTATELAQGGGQFFKGQGCQNCRNSGYKGRLAIHELLLVNEDIKQAILQNRDAGIIAKAGIEQGMVPLLKIGALKVLAGLTTPEEVLSA